jgi:hypothetical protein
MPSLTHPHADLLRSIHNIEGLVKYLSEQLDWPVQVDQWEDAVYDWQPEELNLKPEQQIKIRAIKQLRPLVSNQPWGIFFVDFDKGDLPITVLRRVLNGLVPKSRVKGGGHQTWHARDLLFVSTFGQGTSSHPREIALAHFTDESDVGDIPTLRVLGWDAEDTGLQLGYVAHTLQQKLRWPKSTASTADQAAWREQWASAFRLQYRQAVNDSKTLALALAELAKRIRSRVNTVLALENDNGHLRKLHKAFKDNLIADLSEDGFADMFAQTITYGLFAARASRGSGALVADDAALMAPNTNPFLKELLQDFLHAGGRAKKGAKRVDFDELGINEVVTTLRDVPMDDVLRSFNAAKPGDDPVIHFYELFLKEYDKKLRAKRGVFYTPRPVVQFIVRSVDEILKTEFGIEDGLASSITWGEMIQRKPELKLPKFCTKATPFVQILDPATGTATFIVEVIEHVHAHMKAAWRKQGLSTREQWLPKWNEYVKAHLLPRLYAFELMMAPYAIAHMKIGIKLAETGYTFPEDGPRVNVFLTNALEPAHEINPGLEFEAPMLAHEAARANRVKEQLAAAVVIGNPPYSGESGNQGEWITHLMRSRLEDGADSFFRFNNADLRERNPKWVNNDYVKFFRLAQSRLASLGTGVLGYITSNSYLESPTFRGVRQSLLHTLPHLRIVDLHGNSKRGETAGGDENVFEITEGVAIALGRVQQNEPAKIEHADLSGSRQSKYDSLLAKGLRLVQPFELAGERLQLVRSSSVGIQAYERGWPLPAIAPVNSVGIVTARDELCIHFDAQQAWATVQDFAKRDAEDARVVYALGKDAQDWKVAQAQRDVNDSGPSKKLLQPILYRPFDVRHSYYTGKASGFMVRPRPEVMRHMLSGSNFALVCCRQMSQMKEEWSLIGAARLPIESCTISNKTKEINYLFPLWRIDSAQQVVNLSQTFVHTLVTTLDLAPIDYRPDDPTAPLHAEKIFHYIYAILHSPAYRQRYAAFLRTDFPRIPIPGSRGVFDELAELGAELVAWHLLEHPNATKIIAGDADNTAAIHWFGQDVVLSKVAEKGRALAQLHPSTSSGRTQGGAAQADSMEGKVFVNATSGFANVRQAVWQHTIGGYQPLHKWLDDRRKAGRTLSQDDITHWLRMYAALEATQALTPQIDAAIEAHGGWPGAFSQNHPPPDAATLAAEQMAQKEQLKVQKKAAIATKKRAAHASPTGATSLFDDLEDLAAAAGEPPRPKPSATPAAAAGVATVGAVSAGAKSGRDDVTDWAAMCAVRAVLGRGGSMARLALIKQVARELGFERTGSRIAKEIDDAVRKAVRRGIAFSEAGALQLVAKTVAGYDEAFLEKHLLGAIAGPWWDSAEVPLRFARYLGFARTGAQIEAMVWKLMARLLRKGLAEKEGRGSQARYRKAKGRG